VTWQLNAKNIFDKTYYPSGISTTVVAIGDPREVTLQARVEF
jgi:iron complex outermembrane receptor protein